MQNSSPDGVHHLIEFFGCERKQLDSITFWKKLLSDATMNADVRILNKHFYRFKPYRITGYILLSASHISIHTWPEYAYAASDVFSCGGEDELTEIVQHIKKNLQYRKVKTRKIKRGFRVSTKQSCE